MAEAFERFIGIDWARAARPSDQQVYVAESHRHGGRVTLHSVIRARDRAAVEDFLRGARLDPAPAWADWPAPNPLSGSSRRLVGLNFAFGFPAAFRHPQDEQRWGWPALARLADSLDRPGKDSVKDRLAADPVLASQFRLERGADAEMHLRLTERSLETARPSERVRAESVFQLVGSSQVGVGAITGIAMLHRLRGARGLAVWPFAAEDALREARIVLIEVDPRMWLERGIRKHELPERVRQLEAWEHRGVVYHSKAELAAASCGEALDSVAAAIGLARSSPSLPSPAVLPSESREREGWIAGVQVPSPAELEEPARTLAEQRRRAASVPGAGAPARRRSHARRLPADG